MKNEYSITTIYRNVCMCVYSFTHKYMCYLLNGIKVTEWVNGVCSHKPTVLRTKFFRRINFLTAFFVSLNNKCNLNNHLSFLLFFCVLYENSPMKWNGHSSWWENGLQLAFSVGVCVHDSLYFNIWS